MITFKETPQFLSPSESFKLRKNIQEVEDDLRFFFAWKPSKSNAKTLPNWLDKKLKKFPYLQKHTKNFLSFLHTQTSTFNGTTLIISKKPGNTGISRDIRTEFTTDLLLSD